jgi:hypothetical protein
MTLTRLWLTLHLFFAFTFVGSLVVAEWVGGAARRATEWRDRALLFAIIARSTPWAGLMPLVLLGVFGNLVAVGSGLSMADPWLQFVNGAWLVMAALLFAISMPNSARLARLSRAAMEGGSSEGFESALSRWRLGNMILSILYVVMLVMMVRQARI